MSYAKPISYTAHLLIKFLVTYPALILVSVVLFYSFASPNSQGLKTIPWEIINWVDGQKNKANNHPGFISVEKCADPIDPTDSKLPKAIAPCKQWADTEISVSQAAGQIVIFAFSIYIAAVISAVVFHIISNLIYKSFITLSRPLAELFLDVYHALIKAVRGEHK